MYSAPKTVVILPTVVKTKKKEDVLTDKQQSTEKQRLRKANNEFIISRDRSHLYICDGPVM